MTTIRIFVALTLAALITFSSGHIQAMIGSSKNQPAVENLGTTDQELINYAGADDQSR